MEGNVRFRIIYEVSAKNIRMEGFGGLKRTKKMIGGERR